MSRPSNDDFTTDSDELVATVKPAAGTGLVTTPHERGLPPAIMAEQQRAKSEIEAALTIAAARPRDEKAAMDMILVSCQRTGLAEKSQYEYSRGGTKISGASIVLMEAIAQRYGNLEFGFRELARYPASGGEPGESIVEAFAWDMQTNTRRKVQFSVQHAMKSGDRIKRLTDPRDIYEYVANQAQRRVRTCLENIIPRDIVEAACDECDRTLKAHIQIGPNTIAQLLDRFGGIGVTKDQIESRIQRRIDSVAPAQILHLGKIFASIKDGMSEPNDWFDMPEADAQPKSAADQAKEAMRKRSATKTPVEPPKQPQREPGEDDAPAEAADELDETAIIAEWRKAIAAAERLKDLADFRTRVPPISEAGRQSIVSAIELREAEMRGSKQTSGSLLPD